MFEAETMAMLKAVNACEDRVGEKIFFFTDCTKAY